MYKQLSRDEQKMIREGLQEGSPAPNRRTIIKNTIFFIVAFLIFVLIGWFITLMGVGV